MSWSGYIPGSFLQDMSDEEREEFMRFMMAPTDEEWNDAAVRDDGCRD